MTNSKCEASKTDLSPVQHGGIGNGRLFDDVRDLDSQTEFGAMVLGNWEFLAWDSGGKQLGT
jgi:hypothetical protein